MNAMNMNMTMDNAQHVSASLDHGFAAGVCDRIHAIWNDHDTTSLPELFTDDAVLRDPMLDQPAHGIEGIRRFLEYCWQLMPICAPRSPAPVLRR